MPAGSREGQWNDTSNHLKLWTYGTRNYYNRMTAQHTSKEQFICKGVLLIVIRCNEVTNFLIPSAGN